MSASLHHNHYWQTHWAWSKVDSWLAAHSTHVLVFSNKERCLFPSPGVKAVGSHPQSGAKQQVPIASLKLPHAKDPAPWLSCCRGGSARKFPSLLISGGKEKWFSLRTASTMTHLPEPEEWWCSGAWADVHLGRRRVGSSNSSPGSAQRPSRLQASL